MGQSAVTFDRKIFQGTAAAAGGLFTADYPIPANQAVTINANAIATAASGGTMSGTLRLIADAVFENKGGTVSLGTALSGSQNPQNNQTNTSFENSKAQVQDFITSSPTLSFTVSGTNGRCNFVNNTSTTVNVTIVLEIVCVGST